MTRSEIFALAFLGVAMRFTGAKRTELWEALYKAFHKYD